jgi:purine-nucleoside phosphorylase
MAAGVLDREIDHAEVMQTGERVKAEFMALLRAVISHVAADAASNV